eukprot:2274254-Pyramimonas_sp.AAC.1
MHWAPPSPPNLSALGGLSHMIWLLRAPCCTEARFVRGSSAGPDSISPALPSSTFHPPALP